jgi:sugar lactone lactonase YvrE
VKRGKSAAGRPAVVILIAVFFAMSSSVAFAAPGDISTVAGVGPPPPNVSGRPSGLAVHAGGLYISDETRNRVLRYDLAAGTLAVVAGTGGVGVYGDGGQATLAGLDHPSQLAFDAAGSLYIADGFCDRIRKVDTSGIITTVAGSGTTCGFKFNGQYAGDGGAATAAKLHAPHGVAIDDAGNLFIADTYNHRIRKVDATTGVISTIAGAGSYGNCCSGGLSGDGGPAVQAELFQPAKLRFDAAGNLYFSDSYNQRVRRIDAATGIITTVAGTGASGTCAGFAGDGGLASAAAFCHPNGLVFDGGGNLVVVDQCNHRIRRIDAATGVVITVAGAGPNGAFGCANGTFDGDAPAPATTKHLSSPFDVAVDSTGNLYIADTFNNRVRLVDPAGTMTTLIDLTVPLGPSLPGQLNSPSDVVVDVAGNRILADTGNNRVIMIDPTGVITTVAGTGTAGNTGDGGPAASAHLNGPRGLARDAVGNLYIADSGNHVVRKVTPAGIISTFAGNGTAGAADGLPATAGQLNAPRGLAWDGFNLYIADTGNHLVRRVDRFGVIMTFAGTGSPGHSGDGRQARMARLKSPSDVTVLIVGSDVALYIADSGNNRIRQVDPFGTITTVVGTGEAGSTGDGGPATLARINGPTSVWVDAAGLWLADSSGFRVRRVSGPLGLISTVAGTGQPGFSGDGGPATLAQIGNVDGITVDASGDLYLVDTGNHRLRKVAA